MVPFRNNALWGHLIYIENNNNTCFLTSGRQSHFETISKSQTFKFFNLKLSFS
jgi:hypothetical protein